MEPVTAGLVVVGIVVIAGVFLLLRWRSGADEQQALRHHQHALDTLRTVSDRLESSRPSEMQRTRVVEKADTEQPAARTTTPMKRVSSGRSAMAASTRIDAPPLPADERAVPDSADRTRPEPALVFDDESPDKGAHPSAIPGAVSGRQTRLALQRSARPPSRVPAIFWLVLVTALIAVGIVFVINKHDHHSGAPVVHPKTHPVHHLSPPKQTTTTVTATTSTLPQGLEPVAATATTQGASYTVPDAPYTVTLTSTGACWVYASLESTGAVLWTGVLEAGQVQTMSASGQLVVKLGHANSLTATMNGLEVDYPAQFSAVFTMQFVPSTS
jgi:Domain of unknown function (DUF4115)